jgi:hypothetical protein
MNARCHKSQVGCSKILALKGYMMSRAIPDPPRSRCAVRFFYDEYQGAQIPTTKCEAAVLTGISNLGVPSPTINHTRRIWRSICRPSLTLGHKRILTAVVSLRTDPRTLGMRQLQGRGEKPPWLLYFCDVFRWIAVQISTRWIFWPILIVLCPGHVHTWPKTLKQSNIIAPSIW